MFDSLQPHGVSGGGKKKKRAICQAGDLQIHMQLCHLMSLGQGCKVALEDCRGT